jgi:hypothetical protein
MKNYSVRLLIVGLIFLTACSKDGEMVETPPLEKLDLLSTISNSWELYMYNIITDREKYYFTGSELKKHSLRTVTFSRDGNYSSSDTDWSGTYLFLKDSTQIVLTPTISYLVPCLLNLDYVSLPRMLFSSPPVQVNPEKTDASDYEKFVAYSGLKFLSVRGKDISKLKSIKIELRYAAK